MASPARWARKSPPSGVRFGCRLFGYISSAAYAGQDEFVRQCLLTGGNSLQRQNQLFWGEAGNTEEIAKKNFDGVALAQAERQVRKAGWGMAYTPNPAWKPGEEGTPQAAAEEADALRIEKSPVPTWGQDADYPPFSKVSEEIAASHPTVLMAHLREAYTHTRQASSRENTHPFRHGDWAMMQHGDVPPSVNEALQDNLKRWHAKDPQIPLPKGEVDSERVACYLAACFRQQHGTDRIAALKTEQVREDIKTFMNEIMPAHGSQTATSNLLISDGRRIFGTRQSESGASLFIGKHRNPAGQEEMLLATDPIQPTQGSGQAKIDWQPVAENSVFSLERTKDATGSPQIDYQNESFQMRADQMRDGSVKPLKRPGFWSRLWAWPKRFWNDLAGKLRAMGQAIRKFFRRLLGRKN